MQVTDLDDPMIQPKPPDTSQLSTPALTRACAAGANDRTASASATAPMVFDMNPSIHAIVGAQGDTGLEAPRPLADSLGENHAQVASLARGALSSKRHLALAYWRRVIFSEVSTVWAHAPGAGDRPRGGAPISGPRRNAGCGGTPLPA